jgi:hypothetical protein
MEKFGMVWMNSAGKFVDEFLWRSFGKVFWKCFLGSLDE